MAELKFKYQHLRSNVSGATPSAAEIKDGELAVNYIKDGEKLFIKNSNGEIVPFIPEKEIDDKLANKTDYQVNGSNGRALVFNESDGGGAKFEHNDGTWSFAGVNDGGKNGLAGQVYAVDSQNGYKGVKLDVTVGGLYYTKGEESGKPVAQRDVEANEVATKGDITGVTGDITELSGKVETLDAEKFGAVSYDKNAKKIYFYDKSGGAILGNISTDDFVIDGMIDSVEIKDVVISGETVRCLVIVWNTDAGKEEVDIPLTDIFNPDNYYTKEQIDGFLNVIEGEIDEISGNVGTLDDKVDAEILRATSAETALAAEIATKQDELVSGTNIKTVVNKTLLGSGNVEINIVELSDVDYDEPSNTVILDAGTFV